MRAVSAMMTGALLLSGCLKPAEIEADHAWVRLPAVAGRPGAGYVTLTGGEAPARLVAVSADRAIRTEMHESMAGNGAGNGMAGMTTMRPLAAIDLPAHGRIAFVPGAKHLMLFGVSPALKPGDTTLLTFTFADGSHLQRKAWVVGPGDAAPE